MLSCKLDNKKAYAKLCKLLPEIVVYQLKPLNKGLSNDNYWIDSSIGTLLLKSYRTDLPVATLQTQQQLAKYNDLTSEVHAWCETQRIAVFSFIPGKDSPAQLGDNLIKTVQFIHHFKPSVHLPTLCMVTLLKALDNNLASPIKNALAWCITTLEVLPISIGLCHNDLVLENIIYNQQNIKIIDFEYAAYNDIYFDLAALSSSFKLTEEQRNAMLARYFELQSQPVPRYAYNKLAAYQIGYLLLSIQWYEHRGYQDLVIPLRHQLTQWVSQIPPKR
ncbi:Thiamine kinase [Pseudoalteromonas holothuriae]|uniref:Thiamine kinase n=1 Tax=Pseudoalteromonas holothuriae TaxID=2963714 RepID=A0A9W4QQY3_9GAMM|nr:MULTISPECIES: aminoglycoside phosphotransferase family protein [unclassified Pseudoalteromonas]CAH9049609.1 Thiamine kinase [Pseudoalteromonas sp. CIP111854]CAH9051284.1 Thiamine kinase [Pseudoalteromonas sp. CIP111951]